MSLPGPQVSTELTVDVTHGAENVLRFFSSVNTIKPSPRYGFSLLYPIYTVGAGKLISLTIFEVEIGFTIFLFASLLMQCIGCGAICA